MSEAENKAIVGRWFTEFWGNPFNPEIIDELADPDIRFEYSMHAPGRGRDQVKTRRSRRQGAGNRSSDVRNSSPR
jgi:hypothetical protein